MRRLPHPETWLRKVAGGTLRTCDGTTRSKAAARPFDSLGGRRSIICTRAYAAHNAQARVQGRPLIAGVRCDGPLGVMLPRATRRREVRNQATHPNAYSSYSVPYLRRSVGCSERRGAAALTNQSRPESRARGR